MTTHIPFTQAFVLDVTMKNMKGAVDLSMRKTAARLIDFAEDQDKKMEILATLSSLDRLHKLLAEIEQNNPHLFQDTHTHA
jgi:hypothetical protein